MKILYAAGNRNNSYHQLKRFINSVQNKNHIIKTAAYLKSLKDLYVDYTLDCLLNFAEPNAGLSFNGNYNYYYNEIKRFAPDLIISDCEVYTSIIAIEQGIKLWQVSSLLLYDAISKEDKIKLNVYKKHSYLLNNNFKRKEYLKYIIGNSDKKFVYSHLCDVKNNFTLNNSFQWIRPNFIFSNNDEDISISDGSPMILSDNFYNQKYSLCQITDDDIETIIASYANEYFNLGQNINKNLIYNKKNIEININDDVKFLHEHLEII